MSKKIQLTIPKPCHEDWDAMTPVEKGKFCGSCRKQVVDFSNMSDRQVAEFFRKPSTGSVCGRFMSDQLDREIDIPKKRIPWLKYFFGMALPAFIVSLKSSASRMQGKIKVENIQSDTTRKHVYDDLRVLGMVSNPQNIRPYIQDTIVDPVREFATIQPDPVCLEPVMGKPSYEFLKGEVENIVQVKMEIKGVVIDETGTPVMGASVIVKGSGTGVATNEKGCFRMEAIPGSILVVSGFIERKEIVAEANNFMTIKTKRIDFTGGEVVVTMAGMISLKRVNKKSSDVLEQPVLVKENPSESLSIFPNPVNPASSINIEWKNNDEGYYTLQLINPAGQPFHQREIWIDTDARLLNLDIPAVTAGVYFLVITNKKTGKRLTEKLIVQ